MARSFNDSTDRIDYTATWNPSGAAISLAFWAYRTQGAEDSYFWTRGVDDSSVGIAFWHRGSGVGQGTIELYRPGSGTSFRRTAVTGSLPASAWYHVIFTHDGTFTDKTTASIYIDGSEVSYDTGADGSGTEDSYGATYQCIGGRYYDDARNWGGYLAEMATWNRVITAGERAALAARYSPRFFMNGIKGYWPLVRDTIDPIHGDYGTLDGTAVVAHPPIIYPAPMYFAAPAIQAAGLAGQRGVLRGVGRGVMRGV